VNVWIPLLVALLPLGAARAENSFLSSSEEISPQEIEVCREILFKTKYIQKQVAWLEKKKVHWFYMNYRSGEMIVFEFRDHREDMDSYPLIDHFSVNPRTKECFSLMNQDERIY